MVLGFYFWHDEMKEKLWSHWKPHARIVGEESALICQLRWYYCRVVGARRIALSSWHRRASLLEMRRVRGGKYADINWGNFVTIFLLNFEAINKYLRGPMVGVNCFKLFTVSNKCTTYFVFRLLDYSL